MTTTELIQSQQPQQKITLQQIFNAAWQKFIIEDAPPAHEFDVIDRANKCKYKTRDGRRCAIGLSLPEYLLNDSFDQDRSFNKLVEDIPSLFDEKIHELWDNEPEAEYRLNDFQLKLHDDLINISGGWAYTNDKRREKYIEAAKEYNLIVPSQT